MAEQQAPPLTVLYARARNGMLHATVAERRTKDGYYLSLCTNVWLRNPHPSLEVPRLCGNCARTKLAQP